jgi:hypothetical protein
MAWRWACSILCLLATGCSSSPVNVFNAGQPAASVDVGAGILRVALTPEPSTCASPDECTLVKAAEAAKQAGATHFILLPGHGGATQAGYAYIKVFIADEADRVPSGAMSVEEVLQFLAKPRLQPVSG